MLTSSWRRCWTKRPSPTAPHRRIAIPSNDVDRVSIRWGGPQRKSRFRLPEWGTSGELRDAVRGRGAGAAADLGPQEALTSCLGKAKGREFGMTEPKCQDRPSGGVDLVGFGGQSRRMFPT